MSEYRPPYREGALLGLAIFGLYILTLSPTTAWWDASEYITTGHLLGIPHPPGNPLFVSLARVWSLMLAPLGLPVAVRINLLAAATSSLASFFFFLVGHRVLSNVIEQRLMVTIGAACGALMGATAYTVWNQSTANEKVYTVSVAVIAAVSWLALRWYDQRGEPAGVKALLLAVYVMVLGTTNHLMSALPVPALGIGPDGVAIGPLLGPSRSFGHHRNLFQSFSAGSRCSGPDNQRRGPGMRIDDRCPHCGLFER
jgi:hypothetical protein